MKGILTASLHLYIIHTIKAFANRGPKDLKLHDLGKLVHLLVCQSLHDTPWYNNNVIVYIYSLHHLDTNKKVITTQTNVAGVHSHF